MRTILIKEIAKEMPNTQALAAFNESIGRGGESPTTSGFQRAEASVLVNKLNEKYHAVDYRFAEWQKGDIHRIYVNGGDIYRTGKVSQNAYIDVKTGNVHVFTNSNQPMKWNISQSEMLKGKLEKYGRYVRRFAKN